MKLLIRVFINFLSICNIIVINLKIFLLKMSKKKILLIYFPKLNIKKRYYNGIIKKFCNGYIIYCSAEQSKIKETYTVKPTYLKFIIGVDFFFSDYVVDKFTLNSQKVYIHHDIYDTPLVSYEKEKILAQRLKKYDFIFLPSNKSTKIFNLLFKSFEKKPKILIMGQYPKLNLLLRKKIKIHNKKLKIIIAPSGFYGIPKLSIKNNLVKIISILLKLNCELILRPHPQNREDDIIQKLKYNFNKNKNFKIDNSDDYSKIYLSSSILITDYSGTAYTYALFTLNPVIFLIKNKEYIFNSKYKGLNYFKDMKLIGTYTFNSKDLINKINYVIRNKDLYKRNILKIRKKHFMNKDNHILNQSDKKFK